MSGSVVLDSEALASLAGPTTKRQLVVRAALVTAHRLQREVIVPAIVLAELYRGVKRSRSLDELLPRETGIRVRDTDRAMARLVGAILAAARAGSEQIVDAHVVAAAVEVGGGLTLTADPSDLARLAAPYRNVQVIDIG